MGRTRRALAIVALTLVSCSNQVLPASTPTSDAIVLRVYATTPTIPLVAELTRNYTQANPSVSFNITTGNYTAMLEAVLQDEKTYMLTNYLPLESLPWAAPIGQDGIAIITHPDNAVNSLSIAQIRGIYQGRIDNWADVGGSDSEITVISREEGSGTRAEFERQVMGNRLTTRTAEIAPNSEAVVVSVGRKAGSIGYVSMSYVDSTVRALSIDEVPPTLSHVTDNTYPLRATLFIGGHTEPEGEYRAFIAWVQSPTGQAIVGRHYAPLF
jgi:phosphate transport system substrate-binding protein